MKFEKRTILNTVGCMVSLAIGACIYILFRENTYISKIAASLVELEKIRRVFAIVNIPLIKYYIVDFLWAFSFSCCIHLIVNSSIKNELVCSGVVAIYGLIYETMQWCNVISGTGDIVDVLLYLLAALAVNILNLLFLKERKK